ncbi:unnamed protein product [Protopolystoma xenopodis]|uniref:Uncharacterized protein n=1 Tax=Protopolystoma xenopodis TaxID=117903 RepID=A0A3S5A3Y8_9PLAT|nr:unnamed protein product [Protopolystoma xenopodis]
MHIQLLATTFLLTYDQPLHYADITERSARLILDLHSRGASLNSVAGPSSFDHETNDNVDVSASHDGKLVNMPVNTSPLSLLASQTSAAYHLVQSYAGLELLPILPNASTEHSVTNFRDIGDKLYSVAASPLPIMPAPIPLCLARLFVTSPIWCYPDLLLFSMPASCKGEGMPSPRKRAFLTCEDVLFLIGLANFAGAWTDLIRAKAETNQNENEDQEPLPIRRFFRAYSAIVQHLLPHRSPAQLRKRRTNLVISTEQMPASIEEMISAVDSPISQPSRNRRARYVRQLLRYALVGLPADKRPETLARLAEKAARLTWVSRVEVAPIGKEASLILRPPASWTSLPRSSGLPELLAHITRPLSSAGINSDHPDSYERTILSRRSWNFHELTEDRRRSDSSERGARWAQDFIGPTNRCLWWLAPPPDQAEAVWTTSPVPPAEFACSIDSSPLVRVIQLLFQSSYPAPTKIGQPFPPPSSISADHTRAPTAVFSTSTNDPNESADLSSKKEAEIAETSSAFGTLFPLDGPNLLPFIPVEFTSDG